MTEQEKVVKELNDWRHNEDDTVKYRLLTRTLDYIFYLQTQVRILEEKRDANSR